MSARLIILLLVCAPLALEAATIRVTDAAGNPVATAMVTRTIEGADVVDTSDNGYPRPGVVNRVAPQHTKFTGTDGVVQFDPLNIDGQRHYRVRQQGHADAIVTAADDAATLDVMLQRLTDARAIADSKPSNLWLAELRFPWAERPGRTREHFLRHCGFCHQQANVFMRLTRTEQQWADIIDRMQMYGAMAGEDFVDEAPAGFIESFATLDARYGELPGFEAWRPHLANATITEWPIGDEFSQMHDFILHPNGKVYVGDNLMDRIYAVDPATGEYEVFRVPHDADARPGGILGNRMGTYPKTDNYMGVHSFAISPVDGHIFLTP